MAPCPAEPAPIRVLAADASPTLLWGLARLVQSAAPRLLLVGLATSPLDTLVAARSLHPHVVLLDARLDARSRFALVPALQELDDTRVLLLLNAPPGTRRAAHARLPRGCTVLPKAVSGARLLRAVEGVWGARACT